MSTPKPLRKDIRIPTPFLDVIVWLEGNDGKTFPAADGEHLVCLSQNKTRRVQISERFDSYYSSRLLPIVFTFNGFAIPRESSSNVKWFDPSHPEAPWARTLKGLFIVTIRGLEERLCLLSVEVKDADPLLMERAVQFMEDLVRYGEEQRIAEAQRRAQGKLAVDDPGAQSLLLDKPKFDDTWGPLTWSEPPLQQFETPAEDKATQEPPKKKRNSGRKAPPMEYMRDIVERWRKVEGTVSQFRFAEESGISERTLRNYLKKVEEGGSD